MNRFVSLLLILLAVFPVSARIKTTRQERLDLRTGNECYSAGEYAKASDYYRKALEANPSSVYAGFNLSLSQLRLTKSIKDEKKAAQAETEAMERLKKIAALDGEYSSLASLANYNLGNHAFRKNDFASAINYYKQSLRLNPSDDNARRNLRIAQLKQQNQNKNQDKNQDKDKDKDKDKQDNKDKDKDKDKNKDENKDNNQNKQNQPQSDKINPEAADRILKAMENKESATRARLQKKDSRQNQKRSRKNW